MQLPAAIEALAAQLARLRGAEAVALGGSRADGTHRPDSDWDLGLFYRGGFNPAAVRELGHPGYVSALGEWGPIVNGGAWLTVDGIPVDVLFRDLGTIERWWHDAEQGRFQILHQNGYLVGAPTYLPVGELALARTLAGGLPRPEFPAALAPSASQRWQGQAQVALMFAESHARLGDAVCCTGMLANAVLCAAHSRLAERREWALNEKQLVARAGLGNAQAVIASAGGTAHELGPSVAQISDLIGIAPLSAR